jgi:hypothetical protein
MTLHPSQMLLFAVVQIQSFANTLALTPFPSWIGIINGIGLFWCKEDRTLSDTLLTAASRLLRDSGCSGPSNFVYIINKKWQEAPSFVSGGNYQLQS